MLRNFKNILNLLKKTLKSAKNKENSANKLIDNINEQIYKQAKELAKESITTALKGTITDREKRLENYCSRIKFSDGTTILDGFEKEENELKRQVAERAEKQQSTAPLFSREKIMKQFESSEQQLKKNKSQKHEIQDLSR